MLSLCTLRVNVIFRNEETNHATWKLNDISEVSENGTHGSIRAKFTVSKGPSTPSTTAIQFISEGATLSGVEFELVGQGYRISLAKKRFGTGKKTCIFELIHEKRICIDTSSKKVPSRLRKICRYRSSCACLCSPLIHSVVSNDSVSGQWRPWSDYANAQRHIFAYCRMHEVDFDLAQWLCRMGWSDLTE